MQIDSTTLKSLGLAGAQQATGGTPGKLGQEDFLRLMTTQLNNQNPLKPQDNTEFLTQMAQFGTVAGIQDLQASFSQFAGSIQQDQATAAAGLVGRSTLVASDQGVLPTGGVMQGELNLSTDASSVRVKISDASGRLVKVLDLGPQAAGDVAFDWNGELDGGAGTAPGGVYKIGAEAVSGGKTVAIEPRVAVPVESVTLGGGQGMEVELSGLGRYKLGDVLAVY